jgi:hypothetical protein
MFCVQNVVFNFKQVKERVRERGITEQGPVDSKVF